MEIWRKLLIGVNKNPMPSPIKGEREYIPIMDIAIDPIDIIPSLNLSPNPNLLLFM